jgi:hypothetical protein
MDAKQMAELEQLAVARTYQLRAAVEGMQSLAAALKEVQTAQTLNAAKQTAEAALTSLDKVVMSSLTINV